MTDETTNPTDETRFADTVRTTFSRRRLLVGGAATAALLAACGDDDDDAGGDTTTTGADQALADIDLQVSTAAAGLELVAVNAYQAALDAAGSGALGEVPPAVSTYVTTALDHHSQAYNAWNAGLEIGGSPQVTEPNAELQATVDAQLAEVTDVTGVAMLALMLEEIAADTYLAVLPMLVNPTAIRLAGSIQAVDQQHRAILLFAIGEYPVPEVFQGTEAAISL